MGRPPRAQDRFAQLFDELHAGGVQLTLFGREVA
jgi:hypothetical protein